MNIKYLQGIFLLTLCLWKKKYFIPSALYSGVFWERTTKNNISLLEEANWSTLRPKYYTCIVNIWTKDKENIAWN